MSFDTRQTDALELLGGAALYAAVFAYVYVREDLPGTTDGTFYAISMGAPGALALVGLSELLSGAPFTDLVDRWDRMPGWKPGELGVATVLAAFVLVFGPLLLWGWIRDG